MIVSLIPFFLAARLPIEDGTWRYGPEYIFTVQMNVTRIAESTGVPLSFHVTARLHCVPKKHEVLSCYLKNSQGHSFNGSYGDDNIVKLRENITNDPVELYFNEAGIEKMIVNEKVLTYDLNIIRTVIEQLSSGSNFTGIGDGTFESVARSSIGRCNVTMKISRHPAKNIGNIVVSNRKYKLELLPQIKKIAGETAIIEKTPNLNNCSCYADHYYRKYGDTVICEHSSVTADLENMVSRMNISDTDFTSSTTRTGTAETESEKYRIIETVTITLEDIQPAAREPPVIAQPGETKILANYEVIPVSPTNSKKDYAGFV